MDRGNGIGETFLRFRGEQVEFAISGNEVFVSLNRLSV